jgi:LacI family transcriptional regulator
MDDVQAADDMTTHLVNLGHRRIGFIKGHPNHMASEDRLSGYKRALDRAGIAADPGLIVDGAFDFDSGQAAARYLLGRKPAPSAIFASNDDMAAGVLSVAHERNIELPKALSVVGFDDTTLARTVWPPLTTIRQPVADLARTATSLLLSGEFAHRRLDHRLIERSSAVRLHQQEPS